MYNYKQEFFVFESKKMPEIKMNYLLGVPEDLKDGEVLPMIVFLHGAGERGTDPNRIKVHGIPKMIDNGLSVRAIVLAPQVPDERHVWNTVVDAAMELINKIKAEQPVDPDRVSVTGISMGGYGTWEIALSYDKEFSAIAPICGGAMSWRGGILKDMPIRAFHGDVDGVVPVVNTYDIVDNIISQGGKPAFMVLHNVGHDSWIFAYEQTNVIEWLVAQDRKNKGKSSWDNF